ncbi:sugar transferase [Chlamydiota bacterium]
MFISTRKRMFLNKIWLVILDIFFLYTSFYLAILIRFGSLESSDYMHQKVMPLFIIIFINILIIYLNGLYEFERFSEIRVIASKTVYTVFIGVFIISFIFYASFSLAIGRGVFLITALFSFILISLPRICYAIILQRKFFKKRTLIIGTGQSARETINLIEKHSHSLYDVIGVISEDIKRENSDFNGVMVFGDINSIQEIVQKKKIEVIIVTTLEPEKHKILKRLRVCRYQGVEVIDAVSVYEELEKQIPLDFIDDEWLFSSNINYPRFHVKKIKRFVDIIGSLVGLLMAVPLFLLIPILIKIDSQGSVFYRQKRMGRFSKVFSLIKFRSMIENAEINDSSPQWATENDARITRVGKFIRKVRIDEIPQLVNVLKGDLSLVGPRPERPEFVRQLTEKIVCYPERLYVHPGLTGWAQTNFPYASTIEENKMKLQYDLYYIKHVSFFLDCYILLKTVKIILSRKGI